MSNLNQYGSMHRKWLQSHLSLCIMSSNKALQVAGKAFND